MPPLHTEHKESMLCLRGCPYAPIHLDAPCMFRCCHIFGCTPLYVLMPPYVWMPTCTFGHLPYFALPYIFGCTPCIFGCPLCLDTPLYSQMPPHVWIPSCMFGCPWYVWLSPVHIQQKDTNIHTIHTGDASKYMGATKHMGVYKHMGASKHTGGHPSIWGHTNVWGAYGHPLSLTKYAFFMLYMYGRHPNIIQTYGGVQTYGGYPIIQEASKHRWGVQHMGPSKHTGEHPNIQGASKCIWAYGHPLSLTKHAFFVVCMYRGHQTSSKHTGSIQTYVGVSKHMGASKNMGVSKHTGAFLHAFLSHESGFATSVTLFLESIILTDMYSLWFRGIYKNVQMTRLSYGQWSYSFFYSMACDHIDFT